MTINQLVLTTFIGSTDPASVEFWFGDRMSLDNMLARYPKIEVDKCIHDLRYPKYDIQNPNCL